MKDLSLPDVCRKCNIGEKKWSRRFLKCVVKSFLAQLISEPTGGVGEQRRTGG